MSYSAARITAFAFAGEQRHGEPWTIGRSDKNWQKLCRIVKVCNNRWDWGFVLRITNPDGKPVPGLLTGLKPD